DADQWLVDFFLGHPHRIVERAMRRALRPFRHMAAGQLRLVELALPAVERHGDDPPLPRRTRVPAALATVAEDTGASAPCLEPIRIRSRSGRCPADAAPAVRNRCRPRARGG